MQTALTGPCLCICMVHGQYRRKLFMDRPIVCGALTGLVMGNFEQGSMLSGGTLELVWMGFISYAGIINGENAYRGDFRNLFCTGNRKRSFDVAISIAMPIAILGEDISNTYNIVVSYLMHRWARQMG